jgi:hypothetical protein
VGQRGVTAEGKREREKERREKGRRVMKERELGNYPP